MFLWLILYLKLMEGEYAYKMHTHIYHCYHTKGRWWCGLPEYGAGSQEVLSSNPSTDMLCGLGQVSASVFFQPLPLLSHPSICKMGIMYTYLHPRGMIPVNVCSGLWTLKTQFWFNLQRCKSEVTQLTSVESHWGKQIQNQARKVFLRARSCTSQANQAPIDRREFCTHELWIIALQDIFQSFSSLGQKED